MSKHYDIVISGAGVVGLSLAIGLINQGVTSVALIEPNEVPNSADNKLDDARVIALAHGSFEFLTRLIGCKTLDGATPIHRIHVSDRGHLGHCILDRQEYDVEQLGAVLNLHQLTRQLLAHPNLNQVDWYQEGNIVSMIPSDSTMTIDLSDDSRFDTNLLVIAEGSQSPSREKLGISLQHTPYSQHALVANVRVKQAHQHIAYERFTEHGPMALLPLDENLFSLVWTMPQDLIAKRLALSDAEFIRAVQDEFGYRAGLFEQVGKRFQFPLNLMQPAQQVGHRWALMGNAMHTLHPIAGQGLNLGLRDVQDFFAVFEQQEAEPDLGEYALLRQFERQRAVDINRTVAMTDGLVKLYSNQYLPLVMGRNIGLAMMQFLPHLKVPLATQALGWWRSK